jgi:hypothetical protein
MPDPTVTNGKHDVWSHRIAISGLVCLLAGIVAASAYLALDGREVPSYLPALAMSGFTVLASMVQSIMGTKDRDQ